MNRWSVPYSQYMFDNFTLARHQCEATCTCSGVGCRDHWVYKEGRLPDRQQMCKILGTWQAFRNKPGCRDAFLDNFYAIGERVRPMSHFTLFCDWSEQRDQLARVYDWVWKLLQGSTVCTTKTLHFFAPDMFMILDRMQVFRQWKQATTHTHYRVIKGPIESVSGSTYVSLMADVRARVIGTIKSQNAVNLYGRHFPGIADVGAFRLISPIVPSGKGGQPVTYPNTIGKVLDNIMGKRDQEE